MDAKPLQDVKDQAIREHLRNIYEYGLSNDMKVVDDEPSTDTLPPGERQVYNDRIYENIGGSIYYYSLTAA